RRDLREPDREPVGAVRYRDEEVLHFSRLQIAELRGEAPVSELGDRQAGIAHVLNHARATRADLVGAVFAVAAVAFTAGPVRVVLPHVITIVAAVVVADDVAQPVERLVHVEEAGTAIEAGRVV